MAILLEDLVQELGFYAPRFKCPICLQELGKTAGMIPVTSASCKPIAHMFCLSCTEKLPRSSIGLCTCPICQGAISEFLINKELVNEDADVEAKIRLGKIALDSVVASERLKKSQQQTLLASVAMSQVRKRKLVDDRLAQICEVVLKVVNKGEVQTAYNWNCERVPSYDKTTILVPTDDVPEKEIALRLGSIAREMQPLLNERFEKTGIIVMMHEDSMIRVGRKKVFVYMKLTFNTHSYLAKIGLAPKVEKPANLIEATTKPAVKRARKSGGSDDDDE
jgi:hypothetical protein